MCTAVSYKKLFKLMIDLDMKKKDLQQVAGLSPATVLYSYAFCPPLHVVHSLQCAANLPATLMLRL